MATNEPQFSDVDRLFDQDDSGDIKVVEEAEAIEQSLINILLTRRGERVMRPEFGSNLKESLFDLMDRDLDSFIRSEIRRIFKQEPRAEFISVNIQRFPESHAIILIIEYDSPFLLSSQKFSVAISN